MLTGRDYWTIAGIILVVVLLFQLINVTRSNGSLDGAGWEAQSVIQESEYETPVGDEDR